MKLQFVPVFLMFFVGISVEDHEISNQRDTGITEDQSTKATETNQEETVASQNSFYPSYSPYDNFHPLGHSRPYYFNQQQEGAYSQRSEPFQQVFDTPEKFNAYNKDNFKPISPSSSTEATLGLLGSGNFGVIPGGTFYNDEGGENSKYAGFESYFHNGHGRPSFFYAGGASNPKPYKHEHFANFKDFADINTPERQYSEYVVVYVNNNDTKAEIEESKIHHAPKNIMESLALLDLETTTTTEAVPTKKLSKSKRKLAKLLPEKKHLIKTTSKSKTIKDKDLSEPLLALS